MKIVTKEANRRFEQGEKRITGLVNRLIEMMQSKEHREKIMKKKR